MEKIKLRNFYYERDNDNQFKNNDFIQEVKIDIEKLNWYDIIEFKQNFDQSEKYDIKFDQDHLRNCIIDPYSTSSVIYQAIQSQNIDNKQINITIENLNEQFGQVKKYDQKMINFKRFQKIFYVIYSSYDLYQNNKQCDWGDIDGNSSLETNFYATQLNHFIKLIEMYQSQEEIAKMKFNTIEDILDIKINLTEFNALIRNLIINLKQLKIKHSILDYQIPEMFNLINIYRNTYVKFIDVIVFIFEQKQTNKLQLNIDQFYFQIPLNYLFTSNACYQVDMISVNAQRIKHSHKDNKGILGFDVQNEPQTAQIQSQLDSEKLQMTKSLELTSQSNQSQAIIIHSQIYGLQARVSVMNILDDTILSNLYSKLHFEPQDQNNIKFQNEFRINLNNSYDITPKIKETVIIKSTETELSEVTNTKLQLKRIKVKTESSQNAQSINDFDGSFDFNANPYESPNKKHNKNAIIHQSNSKSNSGNKSDEKKTFNEVAYKKIKLGLFKSTIEQMELTESQLTFKRLLFEKINLVSDHQVSNCDFEYKITFHQLKDQLFYISNELEFQIDYIQIISNIDMQTTHTHFTFYFSTMIYFHIFKKLDDSKINLKIFDKLITDRQNPPEKNPINIMLKMIRKQNNSPEEKEYQNDLDMKKSDIRDKIQKTLEKNQLNIFSHYTKIKNSKGIPELDQEEIDETTFLKFAKDFEISMFKLDNFLNLSLRDGKMNIELLKKIFRNFSMNIQGHFVMSQDMFKNSIIDIQEKLNDTVNSKILLKDLQSKLGLQDGAQTYRINEKQTPQWESNQDVKPINSNSRIQNHYVSGTKKLQIQTRKELIEKQKKQPIRPTEPVPIGFNQEKALFGDNLQGMEDQIVNKAYNIKEVTKDMIKKTEEEEVVKYYNYEKPSKSVNRTYIRNLDMDKNQNEQNNKINRSINHQYKTSNNSSIINSSINNRSINNSMSYSNSNKYSNERDDRLKGVKHQTRNAPREPGLNLSESQLQLLDHITNTHNKQNTNSQNIVNKQKQ